MFESALQPVRGLRLLKHRTGIQRGMRRDVRKDETALILVFSFTAADADQF